MKKIYSLIILLVIMGFETFAQNEFEPNGTILQNTASNTFTAPVTINANITTSAPDDRDFFKIVLPYCGSWSFNLINPNGTPCTLNMRLYNAQNVGNIIINATGIDFNFTNGIPSPVIVNTGQIMYLQIDEETGADLGAYQIEIKPHSTNDNFECNNSFNEASYIPVDTVFQAKLWGYNSNGIGDIDYYKVTPKRCGVMKLTISGIDPTQALGSFITDSATNTEIGRSATWDCSNEASFTDYYLLENKTYYILIQESNCSGYVQSNNPYTFIISYDTTDVAECNNSPSTAFEVNLNSSFEAKINGINNELGSTSPNGKGDVDWYKVSPLKEGVLSISLTGINATQALGVFVYDSISGNEIGHSATWDCSNEPTFLDYYLLEKKTYYFKILESNCSGYVLSDDPFTVTLLFDTLEIGECNNSISKAFPIPINTSFEAKINGVNSEISSTSPNGKSDIDWYKVNPSKGGVLSISLTGINASQALGVFVYDSISGFEIGHSASWDCSNEVNFKDYYYLENKPYYVLIKESNCSGYVTSNDPYTVSLTFDSSDACESNNTFATACLKQITDTFQFKIIGKNNQSYYNSSDIDFFKYDPTDCGNLSLKFTGIEIGFALRVRTYSTAGTNDTLFASPISTNTTTNGQVTVTLPVFPGNSYYFVVDESGNNDESNIPILVQPSFSRTGPVKPQISATGYPNGTATICNGSSVLLSSNVTSNIQWSTNELTSQIVVTQSGVYTVTVSDGNQCTATSNPFIVNVLQNIVPQITVNTSATNNTVCAGRNASFSSSVVYPGPNPVYQWKVNGLIPPGVTTNATFSSAILNDNDVVSCQLISDAQCASPTVAPSNNILMHVNPSFTSSVSVTDSLNNVCEGKTLKFFANPQNGGSLPYYQWRVNGINVPQANYSLYSSNALKNGDNVSVLLFSNINCLNNPVATSANTSMVLSTSNFSLNFTASATQLTTPPFDVNFTNSSSTIPNLEYTWYFGDGSSYTGFTPPVHRYSSNDTFSVTLFARDTTTDCTSSLKKDGYIICTGGGSTATCGQTASIAPAGLFDGCIGGSIKLSCTSNASNPSYQWNVNGSPIGGATQSTFTTSIAGFYSVTVYEDGGCPVTSSTTAVQFTQAAPPKPVITQSGTLFSCIGGTVVLADTVGFSNYIWSTGATTPSISIHNSGIYTVTGFNSVGCEVVSNPLIINNSSNIPLDICQVTVNTQTEKNIIVWEKPINTGIDSVIVYKESNAAGVFIRIGELPYSALSEFEDLTSTPQVKPNRYRLAIKDACGSQTLPGNINKTMHLQITPGIGKSRNLSWNEQEGVYFPSYIIMRKDSGSNTFTELDTVPSTTTTYTDLNPPTLDSVFYRVDILLGGNGCTSTARTQATRIRSGSNTAGNKSLVIANPLSVRTILSTELSIAPNPSIGIFNIHCKDNSSGTILVYDILGNEILHKNVSKLNNQVLDLSAFPSGFYECRIIGEQVNVAKKLVKN